MANYSDKLKDPRWQKKRLEIFERDNWECKICGGKDLTLHVHHKKYTGDPWEAPIDDLETMCEDCHFIIENIPEDFIKIILRLVDRKIINNKTKYQLKPDNE